MNYRLSVIASILLITQAANACPPVHKLVDVNCDGKIKFSVIGDSIGAGSRGNLRIKGSFVKRLIKKFRFATIRNLSIPGLDTPRAITYLDRNFPKNSYNVTKSLLDKSDFVLIELGVNDFFTSTNPADTIGRLKTIVEQVRTYVTAKGGEPVVAVAFITPVVGISERRAAQSQFVKNLNAALKAEQSEALPVYVRFDKLKPSEIFRDGIHPTTEAHDHMTKILAAYIKEVLAVPTETPTPTVTPTETPTATPTETPTPTPTT